MEARKAEDGNLGYLHDILTGPFLNFGTQINAATF
jgi:hypothetical protein